MPKLKAITFGTSPRIPGLRAGDLVTIECDNPPQALKDWVVILRGTSVYLVSPPGWTQHETRASKRDPKGPITTHEIPRADTYLSWAIVDEADLEALLKGGKYQTEPLGFKPVVVDADKPILEQIPPGQLGDA